jgi:hypothetical protein
LPESLAAQSLNSLPFLCAFFARVSHPLRKRKETTRQLRRRSVVWAARLAYIGEELNLSSESAAVASRFVPGFKPGTSAFHFPNQFPRGPVLSLPVPGLGRIPIGDAANGLCGGMAFAVRDLFTAGRPPPPDTVPPANDSPLFRYLVRRLFDSFDLPVGPLRYFHRMNLPDGDTETKHGLAWRTLVEEWPLVRRDLDEGLLSPLGLIRIRSPNPLEMGRNHQVLAYGYELDEATRDLRLYVYDPGYPDNNRLTLALNLAEPTQPVPLVYPHGEAFRGFFRTRYRFADPGERGTIAP